MENKKTKKWIYIISLKIKIGKINEYMENNYKI